MKAYPNTFDANSFLKSPIPRFLRPIMVKVGKNSYKLLRYCSKWTLDSALLCCKCHLIQIEPFTNVATISYLRWPTLLTFMITSHHPRYDDEKIDSSLQMREGSHKHKKGIIASLVAVFSWTEGSKYLKWILKICSKPHRNKPMILLG